MARLNIEEFQNPYNPLEDKMEQIAQYFVDFFGEEYREKIEKRLKETHFIFHSQAVNGYRKDFIETEFNNLISKSIYPLVEAAAEMAGLPADVNQNNYTYSMIEAVIRDEENGNKYEFEKLISCAFRYSTNGVGIERFKTENENKLAVFKKYLKELYHKKYGAEIERLIKLKEEKTYLPFKEEVDKIEKECFDQLTEEISISLFKELNIDANDENILKVNEAAKCLYDALNGSQVAGKTAIDILYELNPQKAESVALNIRFNSRYYELVQKKKEKIYDLKCGIKGATDAVSDIAAESLMNEITMYSLMNDTAGVCLPLLGKGWASKNCLLGNIFNAYDNTIIHEILHIIQTSFLNDNFKTGLFYNKGENRHKLLNEVLNEYFTQQVWGKMKKNGFIICNAQKQTSLYEIAFPYFRNFIEENMDILKMCCMSDDPDIIGKKFDESLLDELEEELQTIFDDKGVGRSLKAGEKIEEILKNVKINEKEEELV